MPPLADAAAAPSRGARSRRATPAPVRAPRSVGRRRARRRAPSAHGQTASSPSRSADAGRDVAAAARARPRASARRAAAPCRERSAAAATAPAAARGQPTASARERCSRAAAAERREQRFVVQVGAFADAEAARETRKNVEKLGLKTYTQVAQTSGGSRIRVRVGPFTSRGEAEAALAKAKAAGMNAVLLTL